MSCICPQLSKLSCLLFLPLSHTNPKHNQTNTNNQSRMPKAAAKPAAKKEKKVKDPNAPKKPLGSYMFFCADKRPDIRKAHPTWTLPEVAKALGEAWGKVRFFARVCVGCLLLCVRLVRAADDDDARRLSVALLTKQNLLSSAHDTTTQNKKVSDTDKKKYEKQAEADKARYAKDMAAYEKKK